jgi:FKBP-type peptidyl-prolyl cis-trans isomerases 2
MKAEKNKVVTIAYILRTDGEVVDQGELAYLHGHGQIIPGLEEALEGRETGERLNVNVPPEKGYGQPNPEGVQVVPRSAFPEGSEVAVGEQFYAQDASGQPLPFTITKVEGEDVTIDFNHPLAGKTLDFEVEIKEIREATPEELAHGHVHGPEEHHH